MKSSIPGVLAILQEKLDVIEVEEANIRSQIADLRDDLERWDTAGHDLRIAVKVLSEMQEAT